MPPITGQTVLIIGGTSGIGYAVASLALAQGARVFIASSSPSRVQSSVASLQSEHPEASIQGHTIDLSTPDVEASLVSLLSAVAPLDHVVFTAGGTLPIIPLKDITLESIHTAGHVRFFAPLLLAKHLPQYLRHGASSSLTLTTGMGGEKPYPGWSLIGGYLAGLQGLTRNLAVDLKPVRVNLVSPGVVDTPLYGEGGVPRSLARSNLLKKAGTTEEVAEAYVYLMRDGNATGSVVCTNGGGVLA